MKPDAMEKHPEGGRFQEVYRSSRKVSTEDDKTRAVVTHIYFSLENGEVSRFHKVSSDEVWNLYRGRGVILYTWDGSDAPPRRIVLSADENRFCHVIPAHTWQAAEPLSDEILVGCTVAPGFEFADFTLMETHTSQGQKLVSIDSAMSRFVVSSR